MPQGNIKELNFERPLDIRAYQYDIVCNGIELSSELQEIIFQNLCINYFLLPAIAIKM